MTKMNKGYAPSGGRTYAANESDATKDFTVVSEDRSKQERERILAIIGRHRVALGHVNTVAQCLDEIVQEIG